MSGNEVTGWLFVAFIGAWMGLGLAKMVGPAILAALPKKGDATALARVEWVPDGGDGLIAIETLHNVVLQCLKCVEIESGPHTVWALQIASSGSIGAFTRDRALAFQIKQIGKKQFMLLVQDGATTLVLY